jgi:hypothetical protein
MTQKIENLDALINKTGYKIVEKIKEKGNGKTKYKNELEKALGVLANDGVYAYYIYVKSKKVEDVFLNEIKSLTKFVSSDNKEQNPDQNFFESLSKNLNNLLFFREVLEKILIYARYHEKAMGEKENEKMV